jgi:hypothetical protein
MLMESEKRDLRRWDADWPARIRINYKNSIKKFNCSIKNINFKGLQVHMQKELPSLKVLKLTIIFPSNDSFTVKATVIWKQALEDGSKLYGLDFVNVKDCERENIYQVIIKNCFPDLIKRWWEDTK